MKTADKTLIFLPAITPQPADNKDLPTMTPGQKRLLQSAVSTNLTSGQNSLLQSAVSVSLTSGQTSLLQPAVSANRTSEGNNLLRSAVTPSLTSGQNNLLQSTVSVNLTSGRNNFLQPAVSANLTAILKHDQSSRQDILYTDALWECLQTNGTLHHYDFVSFGIFFEDKKDRRGHVHDLHCWIWWTLLRKTGTTVNVKMADCKNNDSTLLVYELNSTLLRKPTIRPLVHVCKDGENGENFGKTNEILALLMTKGTGSRNKFYVEIHGRSLEELEVHYLSEREGN